MRREREHHRERGDNDQPKANARRDARRGERPYVAPPCGVDRRTGSPEREEKRGAKRGGAEVARAHGPVLWAGVAPAFGAV